MISASDGCLYLHYSYFEKPFDGTNYEKANPTNEIYRFNIAAGSYDKIETTLSGIPWLITVYESNVVLCKSSELRSKIVTFERINLESGDEEIICDEAFPISYLEVFGQFVKYDTDGESFIYDITSDKSTKLANKVVKDFIIESVTDNYLYGNKDGKSVIIAIDDYINGRANFISLDGETQ